MTQPQMESYMQFLNTQYNNISQSHKDLIRRYKNGYISHDTYKQLDTQYKIKLETLKPVMDAFLYFKNQN